MASNYSLATGQIVASIITPKALTAMASAPASKVYDGTTTAAPVVALTNTSGLVGTESLGVTAIGSYNTKDVATANQITVTGATLADDSASGGLAANYSLVSGQTVNATITAKALSTTGLAATSRAYDATTSVSLSGSAALTGVVTGDAVTFAGAGPTASVASANAGTATASCNPKQRIAPK